MKNVESQTILTIEDDDVVRKSIAAYLNDRGFDVLQAGNGQAGLQLLRSHHPDLILLDLRLPEMDGIDILKNITKYTLHAPVIIISGTGRIEDAVDALRLGASDFLLKPIVDMEILLHIIEKTIDRARLFRQNQEFKQNLEAIFKSIKDAIIMVDNELNVMEYNESAKTICGFPKKNEVVGKKYGSFSCVCNGQCLDALHQTIKTKLPTERVRFECANGNRGRYVFSASTYPFFDARKKLSGCVITIKDETRLDRLENDLQERRQLQNMIGKCSKMQKIYSLIEVLAKTQTNVLITGENGTGKGLVAEALHYYNNDEKRPFVVVNCAALSDNLLESELFGHVKGAFTGAVSDREGRFQMADGGTIFLDEIGDISNTMQLRLLRVIQEMAFERVGESKTINVNVRIIAATNQDLRKKVRYGKFREDLFHRLKVVEITLPSLVERREDIPLLVEFFIKKLNKKLDKNIKSLSTDVQRLFMEYKWPGNIRELHHTLEYAFILCGKSIITVDNLPPDIIGGSAIKTKTGERKQRFGRQAIIDALKKSGWNKAKAARELGIGRRTIYMKIDEYGIKED